MGCGTIYPDGLPAGDQMTTAHARGCIKLQDNSENNFDKLRGLLPVVEDWHAKVCFMQVRISDPYIRCSKYC